MSEWSCNYCSKLVLKQIVPAIGHGWNNNGKDYTTSVIQEATCTQNGIYLWSCNYCGDNKQVVVPSRHTMPESDYSYRAPTCTEDGYVVYNCTVCHFMVSEVVPAIGHNSGKLLETVEATCTQQGYELHECKACHTSYKMYLGEKPLGHQPRLNEDGSPMSTVISVPTCTEDGVSQFHCTVCGEPYTEVIPPNGHSTVIDEGVEVTCTTDGLTEGSHCETCSEVLVAQKVIPAEGHDVWKQDIWETTVGEAEFRVHIRFLCGCAPSLEWSSDNSDVLRLDSFVHGSFISFGECIGKSAGIATVTADLNDGVTPPVSCTVIVYSDQKMVVPEALSEIGEKAFEGTPVQEVVLNPNVTAIGAGAFANCDQLVFVHMPDSVVDIAEDAFEGCENVIFLCNSENRAFNYAQQHEIPFIIIPLI